MARLDPVRNFRFRVEIEGETSAGFSDVEIGASVVEVIEYREGTDTARVRKLPGLSKFGDVTLKRGVIASPNLFRWFQAVVRGEPDIRKDVSIVLLGEDGSEQARFNVSSAWPRKLVIGELHAKGNEVVVESLDLANEGIERVA